jgi:cytidylate kinase
MKTIVSIIHEYGSGGQAIGKAVSDSLGISFYNKELIAMTAKRSGFAEEFVRQAQEKKTASILYSLYMTSLPVSDQLFLAQSQVVQELAAKDDCVIVGACGDYVLRDVKGVVRVFVHAPLEERIRRVHDEYKEGGDEVRSFLIKQDKKRIAYYNYYTQFKWGNAENYHLCIDSSLGVELSAKIIAEYVKATQK